MRKHPIKSIRKQYSNLCRFIIYSRLCKDLEINSAPRHPSRTLNTLNPNPTPSPAFLWRGDALAEAFGGVHRGGHGGFEVGTVLGVLVGMRRGGPGGVTALGGLGVQGCSVRLGWDGFGVLEESLSALGGLRLLN